MNTSSLNELHFFKTILTYSIDNSNHESNRALELIGLNSEVFFKEGLYQRRIRTEETLINHIRYSDGLIIILGSPGSGKTTLIRGVLNDLSKKNSIYKTIDFKKSTDIEFEKFRKTEPLVNYINGQVANFLRTKCSDLNITNTKILLYFLETKDKKALKHISNNTNFINQKELIKDYFYRELQKTPDLTFFDWIISWKPNSYFDQLWKDLSATLKPENLAYFIKKNELGIHDIIINFDNVDSIYDDSIRDKFCEIIRKFQTSWSDSITTIVSLRNNNPSYKELKDLGANKFEEIRLDFSEFAKITDIEISNKTQSKRILSKKEEYFLVKKKYSIDNEIFSNHILKSRINYFKNKVTKLDLGFSKESINQIVEFFHYLIKDNRLGPASSDLSNYDRRENIKLVVDFIEFLTQNKVSLNKSKIENQIILESYLYYWIGEHNYVFDDSLKDVYEVLLDWEKNKTILYGCSIDLLLLSLIANISDPYFSDPDIEYYVKTTVAKLVDKFDIIGIGADEVKKCLFRLYKKRNKRLGLIEMSKFYGINSPNDILDSFEVWLTPRGSNYNSFTSLKFSYIYSIINKHKKYKLSTIVPVRKSFEIVIRFLYSLAEMNVYGLKNIQESYSLKNPENKINWFQFYEDNFCTIPNQKRKQHNYLNISNTIESHLRFLNKLNQDIPSFITEKEYKNILFKYNELLKKFNCVVDKIKDNSKVSTKDLVEILYS